MDVMRASVPGPTGVHRIPVPGHFLQMEAADTVNQLLLDLLAR